MSMNRGETKHLIGVYTSQDQVEDTNEFDSSTQIQQQLPPLTKQLAAALFVISLMFLNGMLVGLCLKPSSVIAFTQPTRTMMNRLKSPARSVVTAKCSHHDVGSTPSRRLIVDTDLGLDDLVALAILRVQQSMVKVDVNSNQKQKYKHFHLSGVTITPGVSDANKENTALLQRLLPPNVPVYYSAKTAVSYTEKDKPKWWTRTAERVKQFLSDLTPLSPQDMLKYNHDITAEQFIANNLDDPSVDYLCMAPLTTVANAIDLRTEQQNNENDSSPKATFYIMGGIRADSKVTQRGESTAPFGYYDVVEDAKGEKEDHFGEFNFALDIEAARTVFSTVSAKIIPLEACTLVPKSLRSAVETDTLSSIIAQSQEDTITQSSSRNDDADELQHARSILRKLLKQYGTTETQWDSISAAIYCNAFDSACVVDTIDSRDMSLSELGMISFPGCGSDEANSTRLKIDDEVNSKHFIYPDFTEKDEVTFHQYLAYLLHD